MEGEGNTNSNTSTPKQAGSNSGSNFDTSRAAALSLSASRRASLGLDFGEALLRRPSGFAEVEFAMGRRGSMDSTTAVLDQAIMDLTRRRLSMAMGGIPSEGYGGMSDPLSSFGGMNSMMMNSMSGVPPTTPSSSAAAAAATSAVGSINARQQQLQEQQREIERRQKELELQRQQLLAAMEERRRVMQHMQTKMEDSTSGGRSGGGGGASSFPQRNSLLGSLGGNLGGGLGNFGGTSSASAMSAAMGQSDMGASVRGGAGGGSASGSDWYVCKICNSKAFANREEAFAHESICMQANISASFRRNSGMHDARRGSLDLLGALAGATPSMISSFQAERRLSAAGESNSSDPTRLMSTGPFSMMEKPLPLAMPPDKDWLTPLHCFVRRHCVEVFTATEDDVATPSKGKRKPINVGQIGIRCPHCHSEDAAKSRERGSVYYPTSIASIYNATMNLLQRHLHHCQAVPSDMMKRYETLKADDARSGTSKKYWVESALSLGLVDTPNGIRFSALPPPPLPSLTPQQKVSESFNLVDGNDDDFFNTSSNALSSLSQRGETNQSIGDAKEDPEKNTTVSLKLPAEGAAEAPKPADEGNKGDIPAAEQSITDSAPLVTAEDEPYATAFSFHLLSQMQPCVFTEADRLGKRKGLPPGFPGLACRHCFGGYGSGRFFPSSIKTLSDTSKTLNVLHNHMQRCRKCPPEVRETLDKLRKFHDEERAKMKFGSQKAFFARIWDRLHSNDPTVNSKRKFEQPARNRGSGSTPSAASRGMAFPSAAASFQQSGGFMGGPGGFGGMGGFGGFPGGLGAGALGAGGLGSGLPFDSFAMQYATSEMFDNNKRRKLQADKHSAV